jgi:hypothetical protein
MNLQVRVLSLVVSLLFVAYVLWLVRSRRLRETDSIVWILAGLAIFILAIWVRPLVLVTELIGAKFPVSTLFFSGLVFLTFISLWMTTRISELSEQVRDLSQRLTLMSEEREESVEEEEGG